MNKPAYRPATSPSSSRSRATHPESDIFEIRPRSSRFPSANLPTPIPATTSAPWPATCELLAKMAHEHASAGEQLLARRACDDAILMIEQLAEGRRQSDRALAATAAMSTGEALLLLHEAHRARDCFEIAMHYFDGASDPARAAKARVGLAKALLALHDPSARTVLEDAGELFEDLGDTKSVMAIDFALRQAEADFAESPRSFHVSFVRARN